MKEKGFTLAEVLITLAIIGVVAAITIPTLIRNYQEKVTVIKVKKMYSVLSQAYQRYLADNGKSEFIQIDDEDSAEKVFKIFEPYLKISEDCTANGTKNCFYSGKYIFLNGNKWTDDIYAGNRNYHVRLNDGSALIFRGSDNASAEQGKQEGNLDYNLQAYYDVNGASGPNTQGKDVFTFIFNDNGAIPLGLDSGGQTLCLGGKHGQSCAAWVIYKGNMDYLHCDDLSWDGKQSCKE